MATDIKISELNLISCNNDLNHIIVNDRENVGDEGITKKITLDNFLTPNIVKEVNINNNAITSDKIAPLQVDCSKIASNTITCNQIASCTINNPVLGSNSVDSRVLNNNCGFTVQCLTIKPGILDISDLTHGSIIVGSGKTTLNTETYFWPSSQTANKFLKTNGNGTLTWEEAVPGDSTSLVFSEIVPVGTIMPWAGTGTVPSDKWLECDGSKFEGSVYPELSAALGDTWGTRENAGTQFYLPNLKGRTILGAGVGVDNSTRGESINFVFGSTGGEYKNALTYNQMPAHRHVGSFGEASSIFNGRWGYSAATPGQGSNGGIDSDNNRFGFTTYAGGASDENGQTVTPTSTTPHNNVQPYAVTRYIIKAKPDDVEQFNPIVGPGLSASDANGQTANITLTSTEIGLKVSDDFQFDGAGSMTLNPQVTATSIKLPDTTPTTSANSTLVDTKTQGIAFPFSKYFETEFVAPNTSSAIITPIDHNLGGSPAFTYVTMICTSDDQGYVVGDEIPFNSPNNISNNHGPTLYFTSSQFKFTTYGYVYVTSPGLATSVIATAYNKWKWRVKAWR